MTKRGRFEKIMREIDAIIAAVGVKEIHVNADDFDIVAEFLKYDKAIHLEGIPYHERLIKKVNVRRK